MIVYFTSCDFYSKRIFMWNSSKLVIKDAVRQLFGRVISALFWFVITKIISSYLWPLRYGDYGTIFRFFAWWTALVDFWIYVIAVKRLWAIKESQWWDSPELKDTYHKFVWTRVFMIIVIYTIAIVTAYLIPAYTDNQFIIWSLPLAMMYSASNMFVWIQQLPLQLFWKMNRLSRSLIIARLSQLAVLLPAVYLIFKNVDFSEPIATPVMIVAFCVVIFSVVASSIWQNVEIHLRTRDLLPFKITIDKWFIKNILQSNRRYGFAYFFSSFHTLIVLMFLWRFFPTAQWFWYSGFWALSLSLIEILLIIPSSLWNSLLHKIPNYSVINKRKSMWNLLSIIMLIWWIIAINFWVFSKEIILFVSKESFLWSRWDFSLWWSDQILPFLWIVLFLSFVKQVFNYLFVSIDKQNVLFRINLTWIIIWIAVALFVIPKYNLLWWVITQLLLELLFTWWAILVAIKWNSLPILMKKENLIMVWILIISLIMWYFIHDYFVDLKFNYFVFFWVAIVYNLIIVWMSLPIVKKFAHGLTWEEVGVNNE